MQETSAALIEQLVYFDNFMLNQDTPNLDLDGQISLDLAAFADDSFVFADEDKPDPPNLSDNEDDNGRPEMGQGQSRNRPLDLMDAQDTGVSFREGNLPHNENFPQESRDEQASSSLSLADSWYQSAKPSNERIGHNIGQLDLGSSGRNQLHSLLNDKIETTKRNKFQSHVGHAVGASSSNHGHEQFVQHQHQPHQPNGQPTGQPFASHPQNSQENFHSTRVTQETFTDSRATQETFADSRVSRNTFTDPRELTRHNHAPELSLATQPKVEEGIPDLTTLPKYPVPPGAKSLLKKAGLSQNQIDLLSALIAQHQTSLQPETGLAREVRESTPVSVVPTLVSHASSHAHAHGHSNAYSHQQHVRAPLSAMTESPASNYGSEHSNGNSMSIVDSPYKETDSANASDATGTGTGSGADPTKRKRNTAASARFRIKKKMKEKEMETKIQQLGDMIQKFELRIDELEMENRFLKNLVIEKGNRESDQELQSLKDKARYVDLTE